MQVSAERTVDAPADTVYRYIADMREHHPRFAPRMLRAVLADELGRLDAYAREHRPA
jgi:uncharacterized protein YndB with AHSA1/START domain